LHLPYPEATFDAVFGHTIVMQFQDPLPMLTEVYRVVKPGGVVGFREPAFAGNLYEPLEGARHQYLTLLIRMLQHNGSNPLVGQQLGALLGRAGFGRVIMSASYQRRGPRKRSRWRTNGTPASATKRRGWNRRWP
jgi:SAM-dependent methyltransferase